MDFAGTPAVDLTVEALRDLPAKPSAGTIARVLQAIRSADGDKENWPRGSKQTSAARLKDFFDESKFLASLTPALAREPLAEDWEQVRQQMLALLTLAREFEAEFSRAKRELAGVDFADLEQVRVAPAPQPRLRNIHCRRGPVAPAAALCLRG